MSELNWILTEKDNEVQTLDWVIGKKDVDVETRQSKCLNVPYFQLDKKTRITKLREKVMEYYYMDAIEFKQAILYKNNHRAAYIFAILFDRLQLNWSLIKPYYADTRYYFERLLKNYNNYAIPYCNGIENSEKECIAIKQICEKIYQEYIQGIWHGRNINNDYEAVKY